MKSITEKEFYTHNIVKLEGASLFGEEVEWFEEAEFNLLGLILKDKIDKDWVYVILAKQSNSEYRAIEVEASIQTKTNAINKIKNKFKELVSTGEFREVLYKGEYLSIEKANILITDIDQEVKKFLKLHPEKLYDLSPRKFEELVASILEDFGYDVTLTQATRDGGSDIIARVKSSITSFLILVECKRYSPDRKVDVGIIRKVAGVHSLKQPSKSIIVTTSTFTKDAIKEAYSLNEKIDLKDYEDLKKWLIKY